MSFLKCKGNRLHTLLILQVSLINIFDWCNYSSVGCLKHVQCHSHTLKSQEVRLFVQCNLDLMNLFMMKYSVQQTINSKVYGKEPQYNKTSVQRTNFVSPSVALDYIDRVYTVYDQQHDCKIFTKDFTLQASTKRDTLKCPHCRGVPNLEVQGQYEFYSCRLGPRLQSSRPSFHSLPAPHRPSIKALN